ncbi:putative type I restriction enzymeP M protein [termite gut metagenome]|uniref:Putative type I restriction enzymeP M protein n=1 Tax=termite gut metagenome TaxID=433724 RepID=A0A5J4SCP9_9ZZZZ
MEKNTNIITEEIALEDNQIICALTNEVKTNKGKEPTLQSLILMLNEEYRFDMADMERDYTLPYEDKDDGKKKRMKLDLVVFETGKPHEADFITRVCIVQDDKTKIKDSKKGVEATLEKALEYLPDCEFGVWTNGDVFQFLQKECDAFDNLTYNDISDFPGLGQTMDDLERSDKIAPRKPANDSLVRTFKRCHDYIYANEGMKKTAFWELLNLIFCKIYDEKRRFMPSEDGKSYRRHFWVGVKEQNSEKGLKAIAERIKGIFNKLKTDELFSEVFDGNEQINLSDRGLAYVAGELAKYSFLDATVDVKGTAYETIVSNTLKQEAGQFFTPRNVVKCMVQMLDPDETTRVLDVACGSGGFLVMVLDHVRHKIAANMYPELDTPEKKLLLEAKYNSPQVNDAVRKYAEEYIYGFDFDPDLKKAARMNMVMSGDGHANIFNINSLEYPKGSKEDIQKINAKFNKGGAFGQFDMIFTNPPFGSKVEVDYDISKEYDLGHNWAKDANGNFVKGNISTSAAPEILFIEQCYNFLKPGGKVAIVLPDGILGNPNTEYVRSWILERFKILASVDLPVETFLPQVGVQASLLFLQKKKAQYEDAEYDVFMAIVEAVGKDRRDNRIYERDEDGAEILFDEIKETLYIEDGKERIKRRPIKERRLDDDLPKIKDAYLEFLKNGKV